MPYRKVTQYYNISWDNLPENPAHYLSNVTPFASNINFTESGNESCVCCL